jgi:two-component system, OmpR family, response regulator MprA
VAARVLIADDDRAIRDSLRRALTLAGYRVTVAVDGVEALAAARREPQDALVLDVMMPGVDGLGVCRVLRADGDTTPVLMLTARVETSDRVAGLDAGADDYLAKPFELDELLARLRALLRRAAQPARSAVGAAGATPGWAGAAGTTGDEPDGTLRVGHLVMDVPGRQVRYGGTEIALSKTEFDLFELLVRNEGIVLDHATIYDRIWGYDFGPDSKNLAVYVSYLRRKLEAAGAPELIRTVRGVGYTVRQA